MESRAQRRVAVLSSHLRPPVTDSFEKSKCCLSGFLASHCDSSDNGQNQETHCVFCKIVRGEAPVFKVYEDDVCLCILDSNPLCYGFSPDIEQWSEKFRTKHDQHSLIIPKRHFPTLEATSPEVVAAMCSKVPIISKAVMEATGSDSFNLLVNNGAAAGQVIFHTHIHIIPRRASDCLWASESLQRRKLKSDQEGMKLAGSIRDKLHFVESFEDSKGQVPSLIGS